MRRGLIITVALWITTTTTGCLARERSRPGWWIGFQEPTVAEKSMGLYMRAPYQPGKIPVVFVHGLLSDPETWHDMITALRADPTLAARYQFWVFRYPTGTPYIKTASELRKELTTAIDHLDPHGRDVALRRMVLVGHSMGGLLAKLQVTHSGDALWQAVSKTPFSEFRADDTTRHQLQQVFFFEPRPFVKRVVFIATPHAGAHKTQRGLALFGAGLVEFPDQMREQFRELIDKNRAVLQGKLPTKMPTSLDHLGPKSPVMQAVHRLRFAKTVQVHSIIGALPRLLRQPCDDGAVPIKSARLPHADSELVLPASHTKIHRQRHAIAEVKRILREHLTTRD